jgi:nucleotide-binding universal stress UspA family protein
MGAFRHILVPTDGSPAAERSARAAVALAASQKAKVTALHVLPDFSIHGEAETADEIDPAFVRAAERASQMRGEAYLARIAAMAERAHVSFRSRLVRAAPAHLAIVEAAREAHCDLIAMGSNGAGEGSGLMGSVTARVAMHGTLPVLVNPAANAGRAGGSSRPRSARARAAGA